MVWTGSGSFRQLIETGEVLLAFPLDEPSFGKLKQAKRTGKMEVVAARTTPLLSKITTVQKSGLSHKPTALTERIKKNQEGNGDRWMTKVCKAMKDRKPRQQTQANSQ